MKEQVTAAEGEKLQMEVDARIEAIAMAARAKEQKAALVAAAGNVDTSDLIDPGRRLTPPGARNR